MLFSLLKHYLDTTLKVSQSVYCFTTSISHGVENYFPRLWRTGISNAIFINGFGPDKKYFLGSTFLHNFSLSSSIKKCF